MHRITCECIPVHDAFFPHPDCVHECVCVCMWTIKSNKNKRCWINKANNTCTNGKKRKEEDDKGKEEKGELIVWEIISIFEPSIHLPIGPLTTLSALKWTRLGKKSTFKLMACTENPCRGIDNRNGALFRLQPNILFGAIGSENKAMVLAKY